MAKEPAKSDQFDEGDPDAIKGGGATTDRGRRDMGQPGPLPADSDKPTDPRRDDPDADDGEKRT